MHTAVGRRQSPVPPHPLSTDERVLTVGAAHPAPILAIRRKFPSPAYRILQRSATITQFFHASTSPRRHFVEHLAGDTRSPEYSCSSAMPLERKPSVAGARVAARAGSSVSRRWRDEEEEEEGGIGFGAARAVAGGIEPLRRFTFISCQ